MLFTLGETHSNAGQFMLELRDQAIQRDRARFRNNLERLGEIMAYEISRKMAFTSKEIQTPLGTSKVHQLTQQPLLICILRAGLPFFNGFLKIFDQADCGFVGAWRKESGEVLSTQLDYLATPTLEGREVILIDTMLATGGSVTDTLKKLSTRGNPRHLHVASVLATPEGIRRVEKEVSLPHSIWTFAVDEKLNQQSYIVPGLGDAGDLCFGEKM
jgi:uracil phosphoribosyltransferase